MLRGMTSIGMVEGIESPRKPRAFHASSSIILPLPSVKPYPSRASVQLDWQNALYPYLESQTMPHRRRFILSLSLHRSCRRLISNFILCALVSVLIPTLVSKCGTHEFLLVRLRWSSCAPIYEWGQRLCSLLAVFLSGSLDRVPLGLSLGSLDRYRVKSCFLSFCLRPLLQYGLS